MGASRTMDAQRLGAALRGPGMDTRTWVSLAIVNKVKVDPEQGVLADVTLMPTGMEETVRVGAEYAGKGWGLYAPLYPDDEVLVTAPDGDPNHGMIVTRRLHSQSDPPPGLAVANPADFVLVIQPGSSVRFATSSGGSWVVTSDGDITETAGGDIKETAGGVVEVIAGTGMTLATTLGDFLAKSVAGNATMHGAIAAILDSIHVALGDVTAVQPLILGTTRTTAEVTFLTNLQTFFTALNTYFNLEQVAWQALGGDPGLSIPTQNACTAAAGGATVAAGDATTAQGDTATFQGDLPSTLSTVSFTK